MNGIFYRILIAVIACVLAFALIPAVAEVVGFPISDALWKVIRICIAGAAVFYIIRGGPLPWTKV